MARNSIDGRRHLRIPERFKILHKEVLVPPWHDFGWNRSLAFDSITNLVGLVPLGFVLAALFRSMGGVIRRFALYLAAVGGGAVSLVIELTQVYMPTRCSQLSDLVLNIAGAMAGAALFRLAGRRLGVVSIRKA